jgi:hypothetical protein
MEAHQAVSALFVFSPAKFFLQKKISSNFIKKYGGLCSLYSELRYFIAFYIVNCDILSFLT